MVSSKSTSNQDLLGGHTDVVFEYGVFFCSFEQVIHHCGRFSSERFKERCSGTNAYFKDLQDGIHTARFYLEHSLPEPLHELSHRFIFLHLYVL